MSLLTEYELKKLSIEFRNAGRNELTLDTSKTYVKKIIAHFNLFSPSRYLTLSISRKLEIKNELESIYQLDNLLNTAQFEMASRIDKATSTRSEKQNSLPPEHNKILCKGNVSIPKSFLTPTGISVRVDADLVNLDKLERLIVVENLQAFDQLEMANIQLDIDTSLVVYRGHGMSIKAVSNLLRRCSRSIVEYWADFDPEGIKIALSAPNVSRVWLPSMAYLQRNDIARVSQESLYLKQHRMIDYVIQQQCRISTEHFKQMVKLNLAITQEHQIKNQIPLISIELVA